MINQKRLEAKPTLILEEAYNTMQLIRPIKIKSRPDFCDLIEFMKLQHNCLDCPFSTDTDCRQRLYYGTELNQKKVLISLDLLKKRIKKELERRN